MADISSPGTQAAGLGWRQLKALAAGRWARSTLRTILAQAFGAAAILGMHILLARVLGVSSYGLYIYVFSWVAVLSVPAVAGLDALVVRDLPRRRDDDPGVPLRSYVRRTSAAVWIASAAVMALTAVALLGAHSRWVFESRMWPLGALLLLCIPLYALIFLKQGILRGLRSAAASFLPFQLLRPVAVAFLIGVALVLGVHVSVSVAAGLTGCALLATLLATHLYERRLVRKTSGNLASAISTLPAMFRGGSMFLVISFMQRARTYADLLLLGALLPSSAVLGAYGAAVRITAVMAFFLNGSNAVLAPTISDYFKRGKLRSCAALVGGATIAVFAVTLASSTVLALASHLVLRVFGKDFEMAAQIVVIRLAGQLINAFFGPVGYVNTLTGGERFAAIVLVVAFAVAVVSNVLLIPHFGAVGAAVASVISMFVWNLGLWMGSIKRVQFDPSVIGGVRYFLSKRAGAA